LFRLLERLDDGQRSGFLSAFPVGDQLVVVELTPLLDEVAGGLGEPAADGLAGVDPDQRFVFGLDRMEVRRVVILEVHVDHDPVELAESWHHLRLRSVTRWPGGLTA
jgi:hypothetical protein